MKLSFRLDRFCVLLGVLALDLGGCVGQNVQSADAECRYLDQISARITGQINPASLPSVSATCVASWNKLLLLGSRSSSIISVCISECRSLHDLYVRCKSQTEADFYFGLLCGQYNQVYCATLYGTSEFAALLNSTEVKCKRGTSTSCSADCKDAAQSFQDYAGCCTTLFSNETYADCGLGQPDYCLPAYTNSSTLALQVSSGPVTATAVAAIVLFASLCGLLVM